MRVPGLLALVIVKDKFASTIKQVEHHLLEEHTVEVFKQHPWIKRDASMPGFDNLSASIIVSNIS